MAGHECMYVFRQHQFIREYTTKLQRSCSNIVTAIPSAWKPDRSEHLIAQFLCPANRLISQRLPETSERGKSGLTTANDETAFYYKNRAGRRCGSYSRGHHRSARRDAETPRKCNRIKTNDRSRHLDRSVQLRFDRAGRSKRAPNANQAT